MCQIARGACQEFWSRYRDLREGRESSGPHSATRSNLTISRAEAEAGVDLARLMARLTGGLDTELRFALAELLHHIGREEEASRDYLAVLEDTEAREELRRAAGENAIASLRETLPEPGHASSLRTGGRDDAPAPLPGAAAFISACNAYLQAFPREGKAGAVRLDKGWALARYGQTELAVRVYESIVVARGPKAAAAAKEVIRLRAAAGEWETVQAVVARYLAAGIGDGAFRSALRKTAEDAEIESMDAAAARGDPSAPARYRAFALRQLSSPIAPRAMLRAASLYQESGRRQDATRAFTDVVSRWPKAKEAPEAWMELAHMADEVGAIEEAARAYEGHGRCTGNEGGEPELLLRAALYRDALGDRSAALQDAQLLLERSPGNARGCRLLLRLLTTARCAGDLAMAKRDIELFLERCRGGRVGPHGIEEADGVTAARIYQSMILLREDPNKAEPLLRALLDRVMSRGAAGPGSAVALAAAVGLVASRDLDEMRSLLGRGREMTTAHRDRMAALIEELEWLSEAIVAQWEAMRAQDARALAEGLDSAMSVLVHLASACLMAAEAVSAAPIPAKLDPAVAQEARAQLEQMAERYRERSRLVARQAVQKAAGSGYVGTWLRRAVALSFQGKGADLVRGLTLAAPARFVMPLGDALPEAAMLEPLPSGAQDGQEGGR